MIALMLGVIDVMHTVLLRGSRDLLIKSILFALTLLTAAYFHNVRPEANALTQFNLTRAIVEDGTLRIDRLHENTIDKALIDGHFYCDKGPINAFLGVPVHALYRWVTGTPDNTLVDLPAIYVTTTFVTGTSAAVLVVLLYVAFRRRDVPKLRAALGAFIWFAATPMLGYSTVFYQYLPACAMIMAGFLYVAEAWHPEAPVSPMRIFVGCLLLGLAVWTLNTVGLTAVLMTLPLLAAGSMAMRESGGAAVEFRRRILPWVLGGLLGSCGYFICNYQIVGSFTSLYRFVYVPFFREQMSRGLIGAGLPNPQVMLLLTFHKFMGMFLWFPMTAVAIGGLMFSLWRPSPSIRHSERDEAIIAIVSFVGLLLYISGYFVWWGGFAYAPRHLIPALPLMGLGLVPLLRARRRVVVHAVMAVGCIGAFFNAAAVAVNPQPWSGYGDEQLVRPETIEEWRSPFLELQQAIWLRGETGPNWGTALGLNGPWSLLPLVALWLAAFATIALLTRKRAGHSASSLSPTTAPI